MSRQSFLTYSLPQHEVAGRATTVLTTIQADGQRFDVWYRVSQGAVANGVETFLNACLVPAMRLGCAIRPPAPISATLFNNLHAVQQVLHRWYPTLKPITIEAELLPEAATMSKASGVGSFFSAGVDACYTLLQHHDEITNGILIHGFDYSHDHTHMRNTVSRMAQQALHDLGRSLIEVDTNIRSFGDHYADWGYEYHGSLLGSIALLLAPQLRTVYVPSSYTYDTLFPWGSHPETDPLWSSDAVAVVHDGCDTNRAQKVMRIANCDAVLRVLRVCWSDFHRTGSVYNCGKCEKCTRTMLDLQIAGALHRCTTFRHPLSLKRVARIDARCDKTRHFYLGSYQAAQQRTAEPKLIQALEECLSNRRHTGIQGAMLRFRKQVNANIIRPSLRPLEKVVQRLAGRKSVHSVN